jgi:hypothetical protein
MSKPNGDSFEINPLLHRIAGEVAPVIVMDKSRKDIRADQMAHLRLKP